MMSWFRHNLVTFALYHTSAGANIEPGHNQPRESTMIPSEDKDQAYRDGFALAQRHTKYVRGWRCPYITGSAAWAMVRGYEDGWAAKRKYQLWIDSQEAARQFSTGEVWE